MSKIDWNLLFKLAEDIYYAEDDDKPHAIAQEIYHLRLRTGLIDTRFFGDY